MATERTETAVRSDLKCTCGAFLIETSVDYNFTYPAKPQHKKKRLRKKLTKRWDQETSHMKLLERLVVPALEDLKKYHCESCGKKFGKYSAAINNLVRIEPVPELIPVELPAGLYYVNDPGYTFSDYSAEDSLEEHKKWHEFLDHMDESMPPYRARSGPVSFRGALHFVSQTKWGDGTYQDNRGNQYPVDSGLIGALNAECFKGIQTRSRHVNPVEFTEPFVCYYEDGKIHIGDLVIDTDPPFEEE